MSELDWLNGLGPETAEAEFLKCCGSKAWVSRMVKEIPFADPASLLNKADLVWWSLEPEDWLQAFRSHPKIGEKKAEQPQSTAAKAWSEQEQSGTAGSTLDIMSALAAGNQAYAERFGYIFIVCATGKSAEEMLAILQSRLDNAPLEELRIAAEEQSKITKLRLRKLIGTT